MPSPAEIYDAVDAVLERDYYDLERARRLMFDYSWIFRPFEWFFDWLDTLLGRASLPVTIVLIVVLSVVLIGLLIHVLYTVRAAARPITQRVTIDERRTVPPEELEAYAERLAGEGNWIDASRALYQAALAHLEARREGHVRRSLTNAEYLRTFKSDWVIENLGVFATLIDSKWYRGEPIGEDDYRVCRGAYDRLLAKLREGMAWSQPAT